ncbi:hypothetical protein E8E11_005097 [Didymella keratinophila]|nr:hypothetical protein E8E11_005097 [Didymella keratinophila]
MKFASIFLLANIFESAAARIYTGFNYGAFWGEQANVKRYADFHHGFELAKNLTNTPYNLTARAFQAAIDTGTNLLLGMWVSPDATGQPNDVQVNNELNALGKAFDKYGQSLADLVIGLSVGNEDVYRFTNQQAGQPGAGPDNLRLTIQRVREKVKAAPWAYAVMSDSDFIGMTAYPYWEGNSIDEANATFMAILKDTQKRAGDTPVWISEIGWPINGTSLNGAVASPINYQRYWNDVGCQVFGKYNTFWFELLQDSEPKQPDWGLLDTKTYQPRIKDLSCAGRSDMTMPAAGNIPDSSIASSNNPVPTNSSTVYVSGSASGSRLSSSTIRTTTVQATSPAPNAVGNEITIFLTTTTYVSATPTLNARLPSNDGTASDDNTTACILMMDLMGDGTFIPVATYANDMSTCTPPPRFTGSPFTMIAGPTAAPTTTAQKLSLDIYAPSTTQAPITSTIIQPNGPVCITSAGIAFGGVVLNGHTYMDHLGFSPPTIHSCRCIFPGDFSSSDYVDVQITRPGSVS